MTTSSGFQATSIYQLFVEVARKLNPDYVSMITPSRWMTKGSMGVKDEWVNEMLNSNHFVRIVDYLDSSACFTGVGIGGGVNYFLYQGTYTGKCNYILHQGSSIYEQMIFLNGLETGIVIRDGIAFDVIQKMTSIEGPYYNNTNFSQLVGPLHLFDRDEFLGTNWKGFSTKRTEEYTIRYYMNKRLDSSGQGWVKPSHIQKGHSSIPVHKVLIPKAYGTAGDSYVIGMPFYGEPNSVCSFTYICIGYDPIKHNFSKNECENIISYMKTRFFRYLVSIKKKTQDNPSGVFQFVPLQDWSKPWTDAELYKKYNLSKGEVDHIEHMIKPMKIS